VRLRDILIYRGKKKKKGQQKPNPTTIQYIEIKNKATIFATKLSNRGTKHSDWLLAQSKYDTQKLLTSNGELVGYSKNNNWQVAM
jgi:hypothetical protein